MNRYLTKKIKLILLGVIIIGITLGTVINYTDASRLNEVTINNQIVDDWDNSLGLHAEKSILRQPLDSLAASLINLDQIYKVDIDYSPPDKIEIKTNNFQLVCLLLDKFTQQIYGVTHQARIVKLDNCEYDWNNPILTSVAFNKLFDYSLDNRVAVIVPQLNILKKNNPDLYQLIEEIDFGNRRFLKIAIDGLNYRLKVKTETFNSELNKFVDFISRFNPDLEGVKLLDLRFDGMIITSKVKS